MSAGTRKFVIVVCSALVLYISFCVWIARDTRVIIRTAMDPQAAASEYSPYMTEAVYNSINPLQRHVTESQYVYNPEASSFGNPLVLHLFLYAKVYVTHGYDQGEWGFRERVALTLKLKKGKWVAAQASINP